MHWCPTTSTISASWRSRIKFLWPFEFETWIKKTSLPTNASPGMHSDLRKAPSNYMVNLLNFTWRVQRVSPVLFWVLSVQSVSHFSFGFFFIHFQFHCKLCWSLALKILKFPLFLCLLLCLPLLSWQLHDHGWLDHRLQKSVCLHFVVILDGNSHHRPHLMSHQRQRVSCLPAFETPTKRSLRKGYLLCVWSWIRWGLY